MAGGTPAGLTHKRRMVVGQLWLRGYSERAIADIIRKKAREDNSKLKGCEKTTHVTVHHDVAACREEWVKRDGAHLDKKRAFQVARLLDIIHQAWADFSNKAEHLRPQYLRIAIEGERELAKVMGTLSPTIITGSGGGPLIPPTINLHFADGTVIKPPSDNGHEPVEVKPGDNGHGE